MHVERLWIDTNDVLIEKPVLYLLLQLSEEKPRGCEVD